MPFSALPFVVREHLKTLTDTYVDRMQNKNINTVAILNGIFAAGQYGCFGRDAVSCFPFHIYMAAMQHEEYVGAFSGVGQILKSKLISMERLGLIESRQVSQSGHVSDRLFLTPLGLDVVKASSMVYSGDADQILPTYEYAARELAEHLLGPLMTATTYIRGIESAGNIWYEYASEVDSVILGKCVRNPKERMKALLDISQSMIGSRLFMITEGLKEARDRLQSHYKEACV